MLFYFFMCDDLSFINTTQKTFKPFEKNVSMARMDEKKLHTWEFQLKRSSRNTRCKLLQKRFTGKTTYCHWKNILSELNRSIFQIPLKYIKLVIPKTLFILVLCSFNFYFKIKWPPPPQQYPPSKIKISDAPSKYLSEIFNLPPPNWRGGRGVHAPKAQLKLSPLIQNRVQQYYLPQSYARHLPSNQKCHKIVAPTRCGLFPLPMNLYG